VAELDATSSEIEAAKVAEKSEVLEAVPTALAPDAASSIAAEAAEAAGGQATPAAPAPVAELDAASSEIDKQAAKVVEKSEVLEAVPAALAPDAEPRLDVFVFLCSGFVSLLDRLCVSCFLSFQMPRRLPKALPRPSAAEVAAYQCRSVRDDAQTTAPPTRTRPLLPIPAFSKAGIAFKRRKMEADACVVS
jgi:hypothetical protein